MNEHDSERIAGLLDAEGMQEVSDVAEADVIVLNTCCIRENADNKLYGHLGHLKPLKDENPDLQIAVAGCLAQKDRDRIQERAPYVDVVFGTHNVSRAVDLLSEARANGPLMEILEESEEFPSALPVLREVAHSAWMTIQIGCDNKCAFCIVPAVRGKESSRPFGELLTEARQLAEDGVSEITLLGQNVDSYGRDLTLKLRNDDSGDAVFLAGEVWASESPRARVLFGDLLRAVGAVDGIQRVRFISPHPKDIRIDAIQAMADTPEVCEHLHFPLQSGSDRVLAAMHRGYTAERYLERLALARSVVDDLAVTTDIIVGFPGETDAEFEETLTVAAAAEYDSAYTFIFSPREGTEAAAMQDQFVDPDIIAERFARLRLVIERSALVKHRARIGLIEEVLVEGPSKRGEGSIAGRTRQNKLVNFLSAPLGVGTFASVKIMDAGAHSLRGELIEVLSTSKHRRRIPVSAV